MLIVKPIADFDLAELDRLRMEAVEAQQRLETFTLILEGKYVEGQEGLAVSFEGKYAFIRDWATAEELRHIAETRRWHRSLIGALK